MQHLLKSIYWDTLTGAHANFSSGNANVRRYAAGFSPIAAYADLAQFDLRDLNPHCAVGETLYIADWLGTVPPGWRLEVETAMAQMLWQGPMPATDAAPEAVLLGAEHVTQAMALAELTHPGPFGPRTIELGDYLGLFEGPRLVAMAGERFRAGALQEISGVCTHPDFQGRGLARRLTLQLVRRQMQRQQVPFLHAVNGNTNAHALYQRMGFVTQQEIALRVVTRCAQ